MKMDIASANAGLIGVIFIFFFIDLDTTGTLIGVSHRAGLLDKDGKLPRLKRALFADSTAIMAGGVLGTSSVTAYVESAAGTSVGGRTGLTAVVVALLFLAALFLSPLAGTVPAYATAPALCYVAVLMTRGLAEIDWDRPDRPAPAVITAVGMPFTLFSIVDGIAFGFISYAVIKVPHLPLPRPVADGAGQPRHCLPSSLRSSTESRRFRLHSKNRPALPGGSVCAVIRRLSCGGC